MKRDMKNQSFNKEHLAYLVGIASSMFYGTIAHYKKAGLQYADVPEIVGITGACENVDTLFKVGNRLDLPLFFTQTGQLSLEQALQSNHGVYTIIHSGRDEGQEDERHLRQFRLTEEEFDCTFGQMTRDSYDEEKMYELLLKHIEVATKAMISSVLEENKKILTGFYKRDAGALHEIVTRPYLRITYEDAIGLLRQSGHPQLEFGDDLGAQEEQKVVELMNTKTKGYGHTIRSWSPVFIMRYPKEIKFFNMKVSEKDPRVVLSADCIFPYSGESVGSAVREHDGVKLLVRLLTSIMYKLHEQRGGTYNDFRWYTEGMILSQKTLPHAGYGIGNERLIQFILGHADIRECSLFSLLSTQTGDWDVSKRGMLPMVQHRKTVLLSIGKEQNKARLLPYIKRIKSDGHVFYATDSTHTYLERHGVPSTRVYKISEKGSPNLSDLLKKDMFDLIVNVPTNPERSVHEQTDGTFIRKTATETGTTLVTDPLVAETLLSNLAKRGDEKV
jgi:asparaginyl-tRNA synthetase